MRAVLEEVHLRRHLGFSQGQVKADAVLDGDAIVVGRVEDERRRRLRGDLQIVGEVLDQLWIGVVAEKHSHRAGVCNRGIE